jgi:hypothetical protein
MEAAGALARTLDPRYFPPDRAVAFSTLGHCEPLGESEGGHAHRCPSHLQDSSLIRTCPAARVLQHVREDLRHSICRRARGICGHHLSALTAGGGVWTFGGWGGCSAHRTGWARALGVPGHCAAKEYHPEMTIAHCPCYFENRKYPYDPIRTRFAQRAATSGLPPAA